MKSWKLIIYRSVSNLQHYCRVCNTQLNSCKQSRIHAEGKKHEKRLAYLKFCFENNAGKYLSKSWLDFQGYTYLHSILLTYISTYLHSTISFVNQPWEIKAPATFFHSKSENLLTNCLISLYPSLPCFTFFHVYFPPSFICLNSNENLPNANPF